VPAAGTGYRLKLSPNLPTVIIIVGWSHPWGRFMVAWYNRPFSLDPINLCLEEGLGTAGYRTWLHLACTCSRATLTAFLVLCYSAKLMKKATRLKTCFLHKQTNWSSILSYAAFLTMHRSIAHRQPINIDLFTARSFMV
jgi:hypothetical protein